jgi:hypothetical protein
MLKKSVIVLLLLITPFAQARAVLICSMMGGEVVEHCCCPGHAGRIVPIERDVDGACCDAAIVFADRAFAGISADLPTVKRPAHDVPDVAVVVTPAAVIPTLFAIARPQQYANTPDFPPPRLYLHTARLRL